MTITITGTTPGRPLAHVEAYPSDWPITNPGGGSATDPLVVSDLSSSLTAYSLPGLPNNTPVTVVEPGLTWTGTTPVADGSYSTSTLHTSYGWTSS